MSLPNCFDANLRAEIAAALSSIQGLGAKAKVYCQAGQYGCGAYFLGEDPNNTEGGTRVAFWRDLSGSGNHIKQIATLTKQPELVAVGADYGLRFSNDEMIIPPAWLSGATSFSLLWGSRKTTVGGANQRMFTGDATSDLLIRWVSGTSLQVAIGGTGNFALIADSVLDPRLYCVSFNGAGANNSERLRLWIDGAWRSVTYTGTIPAALPAVSDLRMGGYGTGVEPFQGEVFTVLGTVPELTNEELASIASAAQP